MRTLQDHRLLIRDRYRLDEASLVNELLNANELNERERQMLEESAADVVKDLRANTDATIMESFLAEYGLSTKEGVGLMCLAEALLRVPDADTIDDLIADKIEPSNWGLHLGNSSSSLVNASTWALLLTGQLLDESSSSTSTNPIVALKQLIRRMGEPVVRTAVSQAMKMLGKQFVLGQTINSALEEADHLQAKGYTYSYDMLGEAARTEADAQKYFQAYANAIEQLAAVAHSDNVAENPGISVKLSALHPRYEYTHKTAVLNTLLPRIAELVDMAAKANIGLNIDAEEAERLDLSLDIIDQLLDNPDHKQWRGFGVVVQAYGRRALPVLDWLIALAQQRDRHIMVRLVKGAYWDTEIKLAQELGLANFPVYTRKSITDLSYLVCAQKLLNHRHLIYPQFATHNAHTVCAVRYLAGRDNQSYEFQRLHGMGESLHESIKKSHGTRCRIYAPVGPHKDLLAYLVRRLLENGANSSFVNQIVNEEISPELVARCPIGEVMAFDTIAHPSIKTPLNLFAPERPNSKGYRVNDPASITPLLQARDQHQTSQWQANSLLVEESGIRLKTIPSTAELTKNISNPAQPADTIGVVIEATVEDCTMAIERASLFAPSWQQTHATERARCLNKAADLYESNIAQFCALTCKEAGKHITDGIAEVREAVDFLRYYAAQLTQADQQTQARGVIVCISPWNFPLAIFTGQIAAALAAGNAVIAKPAPQTPLIAFLAIKLLHESGIALSALQLVLGDGPTIGQTLISDPRVNGVCFTGSTSVAKHIELTQIDNQAKTSSPQLPMLIAETGGLNAMIVDTTALPEQVVRDVIQSAFQSAGQRCSALRILYVQEQAEENLLNMLIGAMDALNVGNPWHADTDVGPLIDSDAQKNIKAYLQEQKLQGHLLHQIQAPDQGWFVAPAIVKVNSINDIDREIFGPVLHVATFKSHEIDTVIADINHKGYGLTFGLHTRIDDRVQHVIDRLNVGNIYVNRNQIGAVVGSQPFGGEGLSGTGPKAGGPNYLPSFFARHGAQVDTIEPGTAKDQATTDANDELSLSQALQAIKVLPAANVTRSLNDEEHINALSEQTDILTHQAPAPNNYSLLPGPTGESNRLGIFPRGKVLIVGQNAKQSAAQCADALRAGCSVLVVCPEPCPLAEINQNTSLPLAWINAELSQLHLNGSDDDTIDGLNSLNAVAFNGSAQDALALKNAIAKNAQRILPFITTIGQPFRYCVERHVCIDTTAAGGNTSLLAESE